MKQLNFLLDDQFNSDQSLEVDVMRFVAIIGIIFWLIFAMIKSIPFTNHQEKPIETTRNLIMPDAIMPENISTPNFAPRLENKSEFVPEPEPTLQPKTTQQSASVQNNRHGIHLQFQSMEDLITMLKNHEAIIYCHAANKGFDLIFKGVLSDGILEFQNATELPEKMWELKNGKDRDYFIRELSLTIPDVKSFEKLQAMVFFADSQLDSRVEAKLIQLNQAKENGILSVSSNGQIKFIKNNSEGHDEAD